MGIQTDSSIHIPTFITSDISTDYNPNCKQICPVSNHSTFTRYNMKTYFLRQPLVIVEILYIVVYLQRGLQQFLNTGTTLQQFGKAETLSFLP